MHLETRIRSRSVRTERRKRDWQVIAVLSGLLLIILLMPYSDGTERERALAWGYISLLSVALIGAIRGSRWIYVPLWATWIIWFASWLPRFWSNPGEQWGNLGIGRSLPTHRQTIFLLPFSPPTMKMKTGQRRFGCSRISRPVAGHESYGSEVSLPAGFAQRTGSIFPEG
jgi:hypothetical protein